MAQVEMKSTKVHPETAVAEPARKGFFATVPIIAATISVFVVSLVTVGLVVHLLAPECEQITPPPVTHAPPATTHAPSTAPPPTSVAPTTQPPPINYRLPTDVMPTHYRLVLAPYMYNDTFEFYFTGSVKINVTAVRSTNIIRIHRHASLNITTPIVVIDKNNQTLGIRSVQHDALRQWDTIEMEHPLEVNSTYLIDVDRFRAPLAPDLRGLYLSSYTENGEIRYIATSQLQPLDARKTFPCFDEPAFKAEFQISIVKRSDYSAISNMLQASSEEVSPDEWFDHGNETEALWRRDDFLTTPVMSTYILGFIVSQFEFVGAIDSQNRIFRNWMRPEFKPYSDYALEAVMNITHYFERYYQVPYPLNKMDQAAVPDFNAGAMENWGLLIYRESRLLFNQAVDTTSIKQAIGNVISHELAHMWFGDLVTMDWWDDIWLNEGFASYTQLLGVDQLHPDWDVDAQFITTQQSAAFNVDSKGSSRPIYNPNVNSPTDIDSMFDIITYRKGASVLRQLHYTLGDRVFSDGIGEYLRTYAYKTSRHPQLFTILTERARQNNVNVDVAEFMNRWILQMGHPVVNCSVAGSQLHLVQQHFLSDPSQVPNPRFPSQYNYTWIIPITVATDTTIGNWNRDTLSSSVQLMREKRQTFAMPSFSPRWYVVNLLGAGFYRVNYDSSNWEALVRQLATDHLVFKPQDRARIIEDSFVLAAAGYIGYDIPMNISRYLARELHYVPWSAALSQLSYVHRMLHRDRPEYGPFSAYMRQLLRPAFLALNLTDDSGDSHLDKLKRGLIVNSACLYGVRDCERQARALYDAYERSNYTIRILPDIRARVLCEGVLGSFVVQWDRLFRFGTQMQNPGVQNDIIRALGCSSEPWILNRYLRYAIDNYGVRLQDVSTVFTSVASNPNGLQIVWDYLQQNWDHIVPRVSGQFTLSYFINNLAVFNTEQKRREMLAFRDRNRDNLGAAARAMDLSLDNVDINIRWMEKNIDELTAWLRDNTDYEYSRSS